METSGLSRSAARAAESYCREAAPSHRHPSDVKRRAEPPRLTPITHISRRRPEDRHVLAKPPVLRLQPPDLFQPLAGDTLPAAGIDLRLRDPPAQALLADADPAGPLPGPQPSWSDTRPAAPTPDAPPETSARINLSRHVLILLNQTGAASNRGRFRSPPVAASAQPQTAHRPAA